MQDELIWAPRFVQSLAFFQIVACLAFASVWRLAAGARATATRPGIVAVATAGLVVTAGAVWLQWKEVPLTGEFYRIAPFLAISDVDRQKADRLYETYRRAGRRDEAVIASDYLFRYAHDRNLIWYNRLRGGPQAVWILWDLKGQPLGLLEHYLKTDAATTLKDYDLVGETDRFVLLKRRASQKQPPNR